MGSDNSGNHGPVFIATVKPVEEPMGPLAAQIANQVNALERRCKTVEDYCDMLYATIRVNHTRGSLPLPDAFLKFLDDWETAYKKKVQANA